ncbi:hypothetical protein CVT26_013791 [Gymnopilus dilepis]|uniref:Zinc/iron permease n=1 Tax=Gymnopilus dilepis TaxID=231916 RepID=A0A409VVT6_9AGAR|nr:hypothetical protein CVT26_013791 [Gymnopilus dilepis]
MAMMFRHETPSQVAVEPPNLLPMRWREAEEPRVTVMFTILVASLFAVSFPTLSKRIRFLRIPAIFFFIGKHFGTGVILATAFIHLLDDAFSSLADIQVENTYGRIGRWTGAIILVSLLAIFLVEYVSTAYVEHLQEEPPEAAPPAERTPTPPNPIPPRRITPAQPKTRTPLSEITPLLLGQPAPSPAQVAALRARTLPSRRRPRQSSFSSNYSYQPHHQHFQGPILDLPGIPVEVLSGSPRICRLSFHSRMGSEIKLPEVDEETAEQEAEEGEHGHHEHVAELPVVGRGRQVVGLLVLQMGIMIHSFVIGLTLSVTSGSDFTSLTTAIIFHQLFEGLSLGIRIAALPPAQLKPQATSSAWSFQRVRWLAPTLSILFGLTTPGGMAIGMSVWKDYRGAGNSNRDMAWMLLVQGIMSAVSAGMLIYAATVEMLAGDFVYGDVDGHHHHHHQHAEESDDEPAAEAEAGGLQRGGEVGPSTQIGHGSEGHEGEQSQGKSSIGKRLLALVSLFAGSGMMVLIALGE